MPSLLLFIPIIATSVFRIMDKVMLGLLCDMRIVGLYENAEKLITISLGVVASFGAVIMPKITNLLAKNKILEVKKLIYRSMEASMCFSIGLCFGIIATAQEFIPIFFGDGFNESIPMAIFLAFSAPLITWSAIIRLLVLIPFEKDKIYIKSVIFGAVINLASNLIFIQYFQAFGAIVGTILAEGFISVYQTIHVSKKISIKKHLLQASIFAAFGILMIIATRATANLLPPNIISLAIETTVGATIYLILSFTYFTNISESKKAFMKNLNIFTKKLRIRHD